MKKIFSLISVLLIGLFACEDDVDIKQPGILATEETFESVTDLNSGLLGAYREFDYSPIIQFNAVFTDQVSIGFDNGGQGISNNEFGFRIDPQSAITTALWVNFYDALNATNRVIAAAENITPAENEVAQYNNILGQAFALRAWAHFELLTYFSEDLTDDSSLGVILLDFVPGVEDILDRSTTGEVFASINSDLDEAEELLTIESNPTYVSDDFITALRTRMAAYRGNYTEADSYAASLLADYELATPAEYVDVFQDESNKEIIFKLERTIGDIYDAQGTTGSATAGGWVGASFAFVNASIDGSPYYEMSNELFSLLDPADVRYDVLLHPTSLLSYPNATDGNILAIGKYTGSEGQPLLNDLKIFRASEMILIRAEAAAANNQLTEAAGFIDQLLDARYGEDQPEPVYGSQEEAFADILEQRRIELAYEGFRWVDLKRLGERAGLQELDRAAADCAINAACSLPISDVRLDYLPIPLIELDANPAITPSEDY